MHGLIFASHTHAIYITPPHYNRRRGCMKEAYSGEYKMKNVLITGVSRGIGKALAEKFLKKGWSVIGASTSGASPIDHQALRVHKLDLLETNSIRAFAEKIINAASPIDVLINNAGIAIDSGNAGISTDALRKTLEVNLIGLIDLTERLLPLIPGGGHIINMSSGLASLTEGSGAFAPAYSISKVGVNMYTRALAGRLAGKGITVSSVDPGWVRTDMGGTGAPRDPSEPAEEIFKLATSKVDTGCFWHRDKKRSW
jgi:NAD(P)-dependent dehydrogenase (short-subunit alcohol dehydrogenase family)